MSLLSPKRLGFVFIFSCNPSSGRLHILSGEREREWGFIVTDECGEYFCKIIKINMSACH